MKSLEILENVKDYLMRYIDNLETTLSDLRNNVIGNSSINHVKDEIALTMNAFTQCDKIKQSLEVLEIIKIKNVNLYSIKGFLNMHKKYSMSLEDVLKAYNLNYPKLTMEELLKLKQWLEVNE